MKAIFEKSVLLDAILPALGSVSGKNTIPAIEGINLNCSEEGVCVVTAYDLERTICDVIRSRNKLGTETFLAALKLYAANPKKDLNKLNSYAKKMRVSNALRQYLEVLL